MLEITERIEDCVGTSSTSLTLPFDQRQKSRLRVTLDNGNEAALILSRGLVLRHGDLLRSTCGTVVEVRASLESVSVVHEPNTHLLSRACYHLGNRHVPLQIGNGTLCYLHDHVLDDMVRSLGLEVEHQEAPFEPEPGAYQNGWKHRHTHEH
ncbi:MAG: urease accessory protein UreE [Nitrospina sp.]|nr:urease accessory protein UreE [Nitrospina sp.]MBT6602299.1 urease accessory protein UreE [Nitrospina sp.]